MDRLRRLAARAGTGALLGLLAAGTAVGVGELVAAMVRPAASPVIAVGNRFVLLTPEPLKEFAIRKFGSNDKHVLLLGIYVAIGVLAVLLGLATLRYLWNGVVGLLAFGAVGVWSAATANAAKPSDVIPTVVGTLAGIAVLALLARPAGCRNPWPLRARSAGDWRTADDSTTGTRAPDGTASKAGAGPDRRKFLVGAAGVAVGAAGAGVVGRSLQNTGDARRSRAAVKLPAPASPAPALPAGVEQHVGASSFLTKNSDFYRVDTALTVPQLTAESWQLSIHGQVDHPKVITYDELLKRPMIERYITMTCVSDPVGGRYVSTAKFLGVPLAPLLKEVGVHSGADQIVGRSSDGMTIGTPTSVIMDGRDAMLAVGMNGEPLPLEHGFPVRMLVPGLYGYVSATKWLVDLEATTFDAQKTYWVQRGWARRGPIRLESRIDTPAGLSQVKRGKKIMIAGVAWHQRIGITSVEVKVGDGDWQQATLARVPSTDTWVQWSLPWTPDATGLTTLQVRATDAHGEVQTDKRRGVFPSGASGWQSVVVTVV